MENLLYRRQFVLSPEEVNNRTTWNKYELNNSFFLYAHPDLVQTEYGENHKKIILLGDLYDPINTGFNNQDIVSRLIKNNDIESLTEASSYYAGRFIIFFITDNSFFIFNDASASRKVYYTNDTKLTWCASQPHVLADYCNIEKSENNQVIAFYKSIEFSKHNNCGVIDNTIFDSIKQLLPNHYLDVVNKEIVRFWPKKLNKLIPLYEGVERGTEMLSGIIKSANERNELMMAVTSGYDTRLLFAASREVSEDIYYFINKISGYDEKHRDLVIHSRLLKKVGLQFNIIEYSNEINEKFEKIYFKNNLFAKDSNLPLIYNVFYKRFPEKVNMPGRFSDISRNFFSTCRKNITPELLAKLWHYDEIEYVIQNYKKWLDTASEMAKEYNYNILELFNWEERNANLYTQTLVDKDIAQEEFTPYNCRNLMQIFLSVPNKYRDIHTNIYFKAMIKHLWPELLTEPFNPHMEEYINYYLKKTKIYWIIRRIRGW